MTSFEIKGFKGSDSKEVKDSTATRPALTSDEVYIEITHSGVCGSDEHYRGVDMVLGHEGIGVVKAVGPEVKNLKIGDRAGWGWVQETCGVCENCVSGYFYHCVNDRKVFGSHNHDQGSFGNAAIWHEGVLFKIPDKLPSDVAAPLMCAGITVWGPLVAFGCKATDVVGVVGIGGLGHLALQFANKLGCEVVALSGTDAKKDEAIAFGAHHFIPTKGVSELHVPRKINHLIVTTSFMPDWNQYQSILAPMAQIYPLTVTSFEAKLEAPFMTFLLSGWRFIGSVAAAKIEYSRMLDFAALHGIKPQIEKFPLSKQGVTDAMQKLRDGKMRYRGVLYAEGV